MQAPYVIDNIAVKSLLDALEKSLANIEFSPDGIIMRGDADFCRTPGYSVARIIGQHQRPFVAKEEAESSAYGQFREPLRHGRFGQRRFRQIAKAGREISIEASCNPVMKGGGVAKITTVATDLA